VIGDLNTDLSPKATNNTLGKSLKRVLNRNGLVNVIKDYTRITECTKSLIDVSITSNKSKVKLCGTFDTGIADHRLNYCVLDLFRKRSPAHLKTVIDWKNTDVERYKYNLSIVPWHVCNVFSDIDDNLWLAETLYKNVSNDFLKTRKAKLRKNTLPWMNSKIRKLMNKRYKALIKAQISRDPADWSVYRRLRNDVTKELRMAEANYWSSKLNDTRSGSKEFWNVVKQLTGKSAKSKPIGPIMNEQKELVFEDSKKADTFNVFFSTIGKELAKSFIPREVNIDPTFYRITPSIGDLVLSDKAFNDKFKLININKAHGADNLTAREMKLVAEEFSPCVANLSRLSYAAGFYPSQWKIGKVKVLWKSGSREDCSNYRPLTLLSIPSKITESVICDNIDPHLGKVLHKNQWGYKKGLSTESLLIYLSETWKLNIDNGKVVGVIFIDFRKAFDSVNHDVLRYKLHACGFYGNLLQWLTSYLENRQQFVDLNGVKSNLQYVSYGVPQGSLLGPRLFSIYVNDFADKVSTGELHLYADDTTAFVIGDTIDQVSQLLNVLLSDICSWCELNRLTIHPKKCEAMIISRKQFIGPLQQVRCENLVIDLSKVVKSLGLFIDNKLSWEHHIVKLSKTFSTQITMLRKIRFLSTKQLEGIYFKMILPNITYCLLVWGSCSLTLFEEIEQLHIKAARIIHNIPINKCADHQVLNLVNWRNLAFMYKQRLGVEMFKIIKSSYSHRLSPNFDLANSSRRSLVMRVRRLNTEFGRQSLFFRGPILWNGINNEAKIQDDVARFKVALKKCNLEQISFMKGTCVNLNKNLDDFFYY